MSVQKFISDPVAYSKAHNVQFPHTSYPPSASGMQVVRTFSRWGGKWHAEEYGPIPKQFTDFGFLNDTDVATGAHRRIGTGSAGKYIHTVALKTVNFDKGIRYLPWKENAVTFMALDDAGQTFFTGPLSGCSIFIGCTSAGRYWAFHANRNAVRGENNVATKNCMLAATVKELNAPVPIVHSCIYQKDYHNFGFVFGVRKQRAWKFYVADLGEIGNTARYASVVTKLA